ncbi:LacI family DNA-binding transcriptional regulator [Cellulomonas shaoxiangyii]|uniref:LacI family transcriptional regulator n=1 Tax=Cellulomonas shaoxiangyii TaxID=2566013 RepID=A0A4P7SFX5_9CELL|nr:LacI family DNA-binding transcriptional regulator [Cellulomonas shaoxiangyii]QCB93079.1 LacI family transcriptional regulator [Cellulomonas shaoxiangyii]TGY78802.1 LacI family transcriptional regulator [Cellulomonas shaoxiangyii]
MSERRVTSRDVATRAGVSQSTVSYVINDAPGQTISAATRERVLAAAGELGYAPPAGARPPRRSRLQVVLVVIPDGPLGTVAVLVLESFAATLEQHGYTVVSQRRRQRTLAQLMQGFSPVAVADLAALTPGDAAAVADRGIPLVGLSLDGAAGSAMRIPQRRVGRVQAAHLVERGHTRLAFAASPEPIAEFFLPGRLAGLRDECAEHGLPAPVVVDVPLYPDAAARAVRRLRDRDEPVTAVCAFDDEVALAVLSGVASLGLRVPDDLAVVGVDDLPLARLALPPITTVAIRTEDVGTDLARHVLRLLQPELGLSEPDDEPPIDLVVRATT